MRSARNTKASSSIPSEVRSRAGAATANLKSSILSRLPCDLQNSLGLIPLWLLGETLGSESDD
jgi:hypothetical protein